MELPAQNDTGMPIGFQSFPKTSDCSTSWIYVIHMLIRGDKGTERLFYYTRKMQSAYTQQFTVIMSGYNAWKLVMRVSAPPPSRRL